MFRNVKKNLKIPANAVAGNGDLCYNAPNGGSSMAERTDNYLIQARQAKKLFLTYDQQELICRCGLKYDETYFYITFLGAPYRLERATGDLQRLETGSWVDGNSFAEVMTVLDWLCDSRPDRYITGRWINIASQGHYFHRELQEEPEDPDAILFDQNPQGFAWACRALGGEPFPGADVSYAIELVDGLRILVQLWHGDEEFRPAFASFGMKTPPATFAMKPPGMSWGCW